MTNTFGGKGTHGLYVPLSEVEQEVLDRLTKANEFDIYVRNLNIKIEDPKVVFGDLRISFQFWLNFDQDELVPIYFLDLECATKTGLSIYKERLSTLQGGQPVMAGKGLSFQFAWDIALHHIDPKFIKLVAPGVRGLTSRRIDKDTGEATSKGNMKLNKLQEQQLYIVEKGAKSIRDLNKKETEIVTKKAKGGIIA